MKFHHFSKMAANLLTAPMQKERKGKGRGKEGKERERKGRGKERDRERKERTNLHVLCQMTTEVTPRL